MNLKSYQVLYKNMREQVTIFDEVLSINERFKQALITRAWPTVEESISELNRLAVSVNTLDHKRVEILIEISKQLGSKKNENCFSLIQKAPDEIRDNLIQLFYELKTMLIRVQGVFKGISSYVEHKKEVSKEIIDILMKDAQGNVYNKPGRRDTSSRGFLLDRQL